MTKQTSTLNTTQTWRLLITPPTDGATNMAIDEAILQNLATGAGKSTLRFYQWQPPCLSLGYGQRFKEVDEAACIALGYTWVRRPTGGRAILHTDELTYSIIAPQTNERMRGSVIDSYRRLSEGLLLGLRELGAKAAQAKGAMPKNPQQGAACFDTPSHYEVTLNGKKLVGSAQVRRKGILLQHGTLPLSGDITRIFKVLSLSKAQKENLSQQLLASATTLESELGRLVHFTEAATALQQSFAHTLNLVLESAPLTKAENELVEQFYEERYNNDAWNKRR